MFKCFRGFVFSGGLTTFSSFALDNLLLFRESSILQPLLYSIGSVILGIIM
ncbi:MAG: CrcB family protein, partial [Flavobacteriaceae bacterium]